MVDAMLAAVYELSTVTPYQRDDTSYGDTERRAYHEGYYCGLAMALKVMDLARVRDEEFTRIVDAESPRRKAG